jgi:short-subunit dehydrogenase
MVQFRSCRAVQPNGGRISDRAKGAEFMAGLFLGIGAGPGIGLSTARRFATEGFRVVLAARKVERLEALADDLRRGPNAGVEIASVDCSDSLQVGELVDRYAPDLEIIHYNAAVVRAQTLQEQSLASIAEDIEVDIASALVAVRQAGVAMVSRRGGSILLTGGILGVKPVSNLLTLSVGKAGLRCAAEALFPDFAAQGVHIAVLTIGTGIAPGSKSAEAVGDAFWRLHAQPRDHWVWEASYG